MKKNHYEVIVVGGSAAGLAAAMALGRALRQVLIVDSGHPCNAPTPYSHNFLTNDGRTPAEIKSTALRQVMQYETITLVEGTVTHAQKASYGFVVNTANGDQYFASKLVFATGIKDILPAIEGLEECWGKTVIHCPYCHGYEVKDMPTGILANGDSAYEQAMLISNWTKEITVYTNGPSTLNKAQLNKLKEHRIAVCEKQIASIAQTSGLIRGLLFDDGTTTELKALYTKPAFAQHCPVPETLGCALNEAGYIKTDAIQQTTVPGVFACGDNTTRFRTIANAVYQGTLAGMMLNKHMVEEDF